MRSTEAGANWTTGEPIPHHCDCRSYNIDADGSTEVPLNPPDWLRGNDRRGRPIMVDACIAEAVLAVWAAGYVTLGSCCGHNGRVNQRPSLVLGDGEDDFTGIRAAIAAADDREFELLQWRITEVEPEHT